MLKGWHILFHNSLFDLCHNDKNPLDGLPAHTRKWYVLILKKKKDTESQIIL